MREVAVTAEHLPTQFSPADTLDKQAQADAIIEYAKRVKDWPLLEQAVDAKIEEQEEFVVWWRTSVARAGGDRQSINADTGLMLSVEQAEHLTKFKQQRVSRMRKRLSDKAKYREKMLGAAYKQAFPEVADEAHQATGTGENEWYTPQKYIDAAREVMGGIDLDPATSEIAQQRIQADAYFTADALTQDWLGRVWLNPPYSKELIGPFVQKLADEFGCGHVTEAIMLTHNYTDTAWFHTAENGAKLICFTRGRIGFESPDGDVAAPTQGQVFFYFGENPDVFAGVFSEFGFVR